MTKRTSYKKTNNGPQTPKQVWSSVSTNNYRGD